MSAIAIIPARGGSRRIPRKNIRSFHGKPIIAYSIETALKSGLFADVVVSTDDVEIAETADALWCEIFIRSHDNGDKGTQEVTADALLAINATHEYACCIYATAPLMTVEDLHLGFERLKKSQTPYVYTVGPDWTDAGQWYWGRTLDFVNGTPLDQAELFVLPPERVCDINTEEDWQRAEQLYATMKGIECKSAS